MTASKTAWVLIALHLFVLNGLFTFRDPPHVARVDRTAWDRGEFSGTIPEYLKLYFHTPGIFYYYEWATLVLGEPFESAYPLEERSTREFGEVILEEPRSRAPYLDIDFEYPPLMIGPLLLPRVLANDFLGYVRWFAAIVSLAWMFALWRTWVIWRSVHGGGGAGGGGEKPAVSWNGVLGLSLLGLLALGQLYISRLDVFASAAYVAAVASFVLDRPKASAGWIAVGYFTKGYSLLLAPLFALVLLLRGDVKKIVGPAVVLAAGIGGGSLFMGWITQGGYWESFAFHATRPLQLESVYAVVPLVSHLLFDAPVAVFTGFNSFNVAGAGSGWLLGLSRLLPMAAAALVYGLYILRRRAVDPGDDRFDVVRGALLLVLGFMLTFKVFSPQFLIWLTPLVFVSLPRRRPMPLVAAFLALMIITQMLWPTMYYLLENAHPAGIVMLTVRNAGLIVLFVWLVVDWIKPAGAVSVSDAVETTPGDPALSSSAS